jgi:hypothetical protein
MLSLDPELSQVTARKIRVNQKDRETVVDGGELDRGRYGRDEGRVGRIGEPPLGHSCGLYRTGETFGPFEGIRRTDGTTMPGADTDDGVGRS